MHIEMVKTLRVEECPRAHERIASMEGLRGVAVAMVFVCHFNALVGCKLPLSNHLSKVLRIFGGLGEAGVDVFFLISGFLIYKALIKEQISVSSFLRRRLGRVYPPFLVVLLIYGSLSFFLPRLSKFPTQIPELLVVVCLNLALLPGLLNMKPIVSVAWSLSYEVYFYLLSPLLIGYSGFRFLSRDRRLFFLLAISAAMIGFGIFAPYLINLAGHRPARFHIRTVMFIFGMITYELTTLINGRCNMKRLETIVIGWSAVGILILCGVETAYRGNISPTSDDPRFDAFRCLLLGAILIPFSVCAFKDVGLISSLLSCKALRRFGNQSYSYYLVHTLPLNLVKAFITARVLQNSPTVSLLFVLPLSFLATLLTSRIFYMLVETRVWPSNSTVIKANCSPSKLAVEVGTP